MTELLSRLKQRLRGYWKATIFAVASILVAFFGFRLFDLFYDSVLSVYNARWKLDVTQTVQIDFFGAVLPTVFSLLFVFYLAHFRKFSIKYYLIGILFPIAFALSVTRLTPTAIVSYYKVLALLVSFVVLFEAFYDKGVVKFLKLRDFDKLEFSKRNYVNALLLAFSYASLSTLIIDLIFLPFTTRAYIGAMGLSDGIMLSGFSDSHIYDTCHFLFYVCMRNENAPHMRVVGALNVWLTTCVLCVLSVRLTLISSMLENIFSISLLLICTVVNVVINGLSVGTSKG